MPVRVVGFDGDDTLWHSETRFHVTQGEFHELLERHVPDADVDRRLAEMEMKNLGIYGYGVKSFTLSMLETAIELTEGRIPTSDLEVILGWGKGMLMEPTELLDGVEETLRLLGGRYDLLLITKGDLFDQEGKLARSGLGDLFLGASGGSMLTIRRSYLTAIRSDSERTSSSSAETSSTAVPSSRSWTMRRWMNSIAPMSTPRVGCAARRTFGLLPISRATITFCWLPPERLRAATSMLGVRTSNSFTSRRAHSRMATSFSRSWFQENLDERSRPRIEFSAMENDRTSPVPRRSSGMKATPASRSVRAS